MSEHYELAVIGSGQGGTALAAAEAKAGRRVVLFERDKPGGSCLNVGCTPSKTLIASAAVAHEARRGASLGVACEVRVDSAAVMRRVREVRDSMVSHLSESLESLPLRLVLAEARFVGERAIEAAGRRYTADRVVIDTGSRPRMPAIEGLDECELLTNETVFELDGLPSSVLVLGSGPIGLELGQAMSRLGVEVTVFDSGETLGGPVPGEAVGFVQQQMEKDGVRFRCGVEVKRAERLSGGGARVRAGGESYTAERVLVVAGRRPATESLDCGAGGVRLGEKGEVLIDDRYATSAQGVFAVGECAGRPAFTNVSYEDGVRLRGLLYGDDGSSRSAAEVAARHPGDRVVSWCMFTDPQVAVVGRVPDEGDGDLVTVTKPLTHAQRRTEWGHPDGALMLTAGRSDGRLVGAVFVAREAGELAHSMVDAVQRGAHWTVLARLVGIHPTYGELVAGAASGLGEKLDGG